MSCWGDRTLSCTQPARSVGCFFGDESCSPGAVTCCDCRWQETEWSHGISSPPVSSCQVWPTCHKYLVPRAIFVRNVTWLCNVHSLNFGLVKAKTLVGYNWLSLPKEGCQYQTMFWVKACGSLECLVTHDRFSDTVQYSTWNASAKSCRHYPVCVVTGWLSGEGLSFSLIERQTFPATTTPLIPDTCRNHYRAQLMFHQHLYWMDMWVC